MEAIEHSDREPRARELRGGLRKRIFAWLLAKGNARYERLIAERKQRLLGGLSGTVVEIGPGAGPNLAYYAPDVRWIGIEPNPYLRRYLAEEAANRGLKIEVQEGTAESVRLPGETADAVVSTLVLCSVQNVPRALAEILRVLKPGGRFVFIEHVAAPPGTPLRHMQGWLRPLFRVFADGCHLDRETWAEIERAGFAEVKMEHFDGPLPIALARPHVSGIARKAS